VGRKRNKRVREGERERAWRGMGGREGKRGIKGGR
jgi:hypothetical protein